MVMPKVEEQKKQYTVMLRPSFVDKLDVGASGLGLSRSRAIGLFVENGLEFYHFLDELGLSYNFKNTHLLNLLRDALRCGDFYIDDDGELAKR